MWSQRLLPVFLLFVVQQICATITNIEQDHACPPSSCGKITNISNPFRLKTDAKHCGDNRYELACENNVTVLYLYSGKYQVQAINYNNFTIRVTDPGIQPQNCSSLPRHFLSQSNFSDTDNYAAAGPYQAIRWSGFLHNHTKELVFQQIVFLNCNKSMTKINRKYVDTSRCGVNWHSKEYTYTYAIAGDLKAEDFEVGCRVKLVAPTSCWGLDTNHLYSYTAMHSALVYGFELSWMNFACEDSCRSLNMDCYFDTSSQKPQCWDSSSSSSGNDIFTMVEHIVLLSWRFCLLVALIVSIIYKWQKLRHLSVYENIENYLEYNNLMPIKYSYKEIKKMSEGFKNKLGEGGFGSVFKGELLNGSCVAIKMLDKSKGNGQDFISEVTTIGRIHHHNIVQLIGFCVEGSKGMLVYEFMSNGSLDKFIFPTDQSIHLSYEKIYNISIEVARGIAYLHHRCEMQILHFDIKPHNILLDENFIPKISDFGLAKLYPIDNSTATMTEIRGTIGYMAPELFYKNIGEISHKADVYSFGMLLMEMAGKRKNLNPHAERSNELYFPFWIYNVEEKDIKMEDVTKEEKKIAKKMIIVALWCIQLTPNDRPSMNKVVEMLEGNIQNLQIPPKPTLYPHETMINDQTTNSLQTTSNDFISSKFSM